MVKTRRRRQSPELDGEVYGSDSWMMSYSDLMTLLFAFFVLLFALSEFDPVRMQIVTQSLQKSIGGAQVEPRITLSQIQNDLEQIVSTEGLENTVSVNRDKHGVSLSLRGSSFFRSGSAKLLPRAEGFLAVITKQIGKVPYQIAVEGHTDDLPISSDIYPSNWELSSARAAMVVRFFIDGGLPASRFRAVGYADTHPADPNVNNKTADARARNRRVVIMFLDVTD